MYVLDELASEIYQYIAGEAVSSISAEIENIPDSETSQMAYEVYFLC